VNSGRLAWAIGAYLVGTFPSAYLVARLNRADRVIRAARRGSSEGDAHVLIDKHVGKVWGSIAAGLDVLKGLVYTVLAKYVGHLPPVWLASVGVLVVVGHSFPFYLQSLAGRGLSAASGVLLALLPLAMVVAGAIIVVGYVSRTTGPASTLGFALAPLVALAQGEPGDLTVMAACIFGVILLRRLPGTSEAAASAGWARAVVRRLLFDSDSPARGPRGARADSPHEWPVQP
jgi:acyl phosphate:glycerol-3-phosphate acyltransferase